MVFHVHYISENTYDYILYKHIYSIHIYIHIHIKCHIPDTTLHMSHLTYYVVNYQITCIHIIHTCTWIYQSRRVDAQVIYQSLDGPIENITILDWVGWAFACWVFLCLFRFMHHCSLCHCQIIDQQDHAKRGYHDKLVPQMRLMQRGSTMVYHHINICKHLQPYVICISYWCLVGNEGMIHNNH